MILGKPLKIVQLCWFNAGYQTCHRIFLKLRSFRRYGRKHSISKRRRIITQIERFPSLWKKCLTETETYVVFCFIFPRMRSELSQQSIMKQAQDEHRCNVDLLNHFWCMVTSLYLIMLGGVRSIKPLSLFDTKVVL